MKPRGILFQPMDVACEIGESESVLDVALRHDVELNHSCGGMGSCTTCRIVVVHCEEPLPERNELEQDIADMRKFAPEERLACQLPPVEGLVVRVPGQPPVT